MRKTSSKVSEVEVTPEVEVKSLIEVMPVYAAMWEPYQSIRMEQGRFTEVEETNWVTCQIKAGKLKKKD